MYFVRLLIVQDEIAVFIDGKPGAICAIKSPSIEHALNRKQRARCESIMAKPPCHDNDVC